jgi:hypothetical protein
MYNVSNPAAPVLISTIQTYPQNGYNHSAWLTDDGKTMVFTDENRGSAVKVFDITDIRDEKLISMIRSNALNVPDPAGPDGSIAHNPYIVGNKLFISYYHDGVVVYDISDPKKPIQTGFHRTYPEATGYNGFAGCWGIYPFLPSGTIIASDIKNGLFLIDGSYVLNESVSAPVVSGFSVAPNPVTNQLTIYAGGGTGPEFVVVIYDMQGRLIMERKFNEPSGVLIMETQNLSKGAYVVSVLYGTDYRNLRFLKS